MSHIYLHSAHLYLSVYYMHVPLEFFFLLFLPAGARASARTAGPKIALRFSRLFVCAYVRTYHVRNILRHTLLCNCMQCIAALEVCRPSYSK